MIIIGVVLPRFIVISIFIFEVCNQHLHYYFFALPLLIIPFLFKFFIFVIKDFGPRIMPELRDMVIIEEVETKQDPERPNITWFKKSLKMKPGYDYLNPTEFWNTVYLPVAAIEVEINDNFKPKYTKIKLVTLCVYYTILASGWGYIIITHFFSIY